MIDLYASRLIAGLCGTALVCVMTVQFAHAETHQQIKERCKEAVHPQMQACMHASRGSGNREARHEACRERVGRPLVHACVQREQQRGAARVAPPPPPKQQTLPLPAGVVLARPAFVAPPRTIADITAILDSEKPDAKAIAARKATADAGPPAGVKPADLAQFYYDRGNARALLGRDKEALADGLQALAVGERGIEYRRLRRIRQFVGLRYKAVGDLKQAQATFDTILRDGKTRHRGGTINALQNLVQIAIRMGNVSEADAYARRVEALVQEARGSPGPKWRAHYAVSGNSWEAHAAAARGLIYDARGQYADAEAAFRRSGAFRIASLKDRPKVAFPPPPEQIEQAADVTLLAIARDEVRLGQLSEAEADARRALLDILRQHGKYTPVTPRFMVGLAGVLIAQGRYPEADQLARAALGIQREIGIGDDAPQSVRILAQRGKILVLQHKTKLAASVYAELDKAVAQWPPERRAAFKVDGSRIAALYAAGQIPAGIAAAEALVKREIGRSGEGSFDTAAARGTLAIGYARAGRNADAIRVFKTVIPILLAQQREDAANADSVISATRTNRLQRIVETYIGLLAHTLGASTDVGAESFPMADAVRGRAVQDALADSSARLIVKQPALVKLVRTDQDLAKQISAELGVLNNLLAVPQRDDLKVQTVNAEIDKLRAERKTAHEEIKRRFPSYANLVDPKPPSVEEIKATLRPGEALLSFYFGQTASFIWAVPKSGPVAFAVIPLTAPELAAEVHQLRKALEPKGPLVEEIPPFDVALAYRLYATLLKPVEAGWKDAKSLIVVTNGALGELPLGLLPTVPATVDLAAKPLFAGYRSVPWLARTHTVTEVPSASALIMLRHLPPGAPGRDKLIGFGDPYFSEQEAAEADQDEAPARVASGSGNSIATRGIALKLRAAPHTENADRAELSSLPRLPDTRAELIAIAHALGADPAKALYLGKAANEQNVKTLDLSHYRIVAFATHGLVPGDIDGLTQPALALTAPDVAGVQGEGLLIMGEILALRLDADWVVLSACNTAAGSDAGAEAASGLGSAFFYAGTRALLVTNWSVQSASARALIGDLFHRQSVDPNLSRAEALRQAMMALLDGPGYVDQLGNTLFTYAHPLFWAPYSVIGDGGTD